MESKLIEKINQNYSMILNILKRFLKENFVKFKQNSKNYESFERDSLNNKDNDINKFLNDFRNKNEDILHEFENIKMKINELINPFFKKQ